MGTLARRQRHHQEIRSRILRTACDIARKEGWQSVSVRKIADLIEYSPPILYEHFENKEKLLATIRQEGFDRLKTEFLHIKDFYKNPEKQLIEVAAVIWKFAAENPEIFQVMFNIQGAYCSSEAVYQNEMDYTGNPVWEMIAAFKPKFAEAVNKTFREWWVITYGFLILKMTVTTGEQNGFNENLYMENARRYLRSIL